MANSCFFKKFNQGYEFHRNSFHGKGNIISLVTVRQSFNKKLYIFQTFLARIYQHPQPFCNLWTTQKNKLDEVNKQYLYKKIFDSVWMRMQRKLFVPGGAWTLGLQEKFRSRSFIWKSNKTVFLQKMCMYIYQINTSTINLENVT